MTGILIHQSQFDVERAAFGCFYHMNYHMNNTTTCILIMLVVILMKTKIYCLINLDETSGIGNKFILINL